MNPDQEQSWQQNGARAAMRAKSPGLFIDQHVSPLLYRRTRDINGRNIPDRTFLAEEQFWGDGNVVLKSIRLNAFKLTDWFPRAPGVYWSQHARRVREYVYSEEPHSDRQLGRYYSPKSKMALIEEGGLGTIRLRPRRIDGEDCWLATALSGSQCHEGIPLAIPETAIQQVSINWGDRVNIQGRVRFLQEAGLDETAATVHHARPLIVFVDRLEGVKDRQPFEPIIITPVALFDSDSRHGHREANYTFVQCGAGSDVELDMAGEWIELYTARHKGRVVTNFDEQRPFLADAPLSYQRLVAKTYERNVITSYGGTIHVGRIDQLLQTSVSTQNYGDIHVGHKIKVGGSAIISIESVLTNVTQTIEAAHGLNDAQKTQLEALVSSLKTELEAVEATHAEEAKEIVTALEKAVGNASKPDAERKKSILEVSAKGLKEAAELVKDVAPAVIMIASQIAKFIVGLQ